MDAAYGLIYCWGAFQAGTYWSSATPLSGALPFVQTVAGWSFTCGLTSNGAAYCWGWNGYGQLGDGTVTNRTVPTPVAGGHVFVRLAAGGGGHMCGIAADGITYCWGYNGSGQLGDGTFVNRSLPTAVVR